MKARVVLTDALRILGGFTLLVLACNNRIIASIIVVSMIIVESYRHSDRKNRFDALDRSDASAYIEFIKSSDTKKFYTIRLFGLIGGIFGALVTVYIIAYGTIFKPGPYWKYFSIPAGICLFVSIIIHRKLLFPPPPSRSYTSFGGSSYSGGSYTDHNPNVSQSSATSSPSFNKDPNEGYHVTGYDAYGSSERRDNFGLTTQRKNDFGHWENV